MFTLRAGDCESKDQAHSLAMPLSENKQRMANGELYTAFTPELIAERARCKHACARYTNAGEVPRRKLTELFKE